jgi:glycosyltransferase involved in cell wall biosynthesis
MEKQTLTLVMCVKNEEKGLEKAILSVRDFVDEIVICIDDSTTDQTELIARRYTGNVRFFKWCDDFSAMRNFAHSGVKSDWIIFIDGHEYVENGDKIKNVLNTKNNGLIVPIKMDNGVVFPGLRIYRNGLHFQGGVHEVVLCNTVTSVSGFTIIHDRVNYCSAETSKARDFQRDAQMPRILFKDLEKNKKDICAAFHLGLYFQSHGQNKQAIKYYKIYLKYSLDPFQRWYVYFNLSFCHLALGNFFRAFISARSADKETPNRWEVNRLYGMIFMAKRQYARAVSYFLSSLDRVPAQGIYFPFGAELYSVWTNIGECFFNMREFMSAYDAFKRASEVADEEIKKQFSKDRSELMLAIFKSI